MLVGKKVLARLPWGGGPGGVHLAGSWTPPKRQKVQNQPEFRGDRPKTTQTHDFGPCSTPFSKFRHFFVLKVFLAQLYFSRNPRGEPQPGWELLVWKKGAAVWASLPPGEGPLRLKNTPCCFQQKKSGKIIKNTNLSKLTKYCQNLRKDETVQKKLHLGFHFFFEIPNVHLKL